MSAAREGDTGLGQFVLKTPRVSFLLAPLQERYPRLGSLTLLAFRHRKNVLYQVQVVNNSIMQSATAAADALDEAVQAEKARDEERDAALSTALIVSPGSPPEVQSGYSAYIPEAIAQQSWLLSAPINVAGHLASRLLARRKRRLWCQLRGANVVVGRTARLAVCWRSLMGSTCS